MAQERDDLPDLRVAQLFIPRRHARPTNAVLDDVEVFIFRHVGRIHPELRRGRIEGIAKLSRHVSGIAVASGAVVAI